MIEVKIIINKTRNIIKKINERQLVSEILRIGGARNIDTVFYLKYGVLLF